MALQRVGRHFAARVNRVQGRQANEHIHNAREGRLGAEQRRDEIVVEQADQAPVQAADDQQDHGDPVQCVHPGLVQGASMGEGLGNQFLSHIREVDAILQMVRFFDDTDVIHVHGEIDPVRDIEVINLELVLADQQV